MLDQGLRFRYAAISMNDRLQHKGKHRKCRVPACHLPVGYLFNTDFFPTGTIASGGWFKDHPPD